MEKKMRLHDFEWYVERLDQAVKNLEKIIQQPPGFSKEKVSITIFLCKKEFGLSNEINAENISNNLDDAISYYSDKFKIRICFGDLYGSKKSTAMFVFDVAHKTSKLENQEIDPRHNFLGLDKALLSLSFKTGFVFLRKIRHENDQKILWAKAVGNMEQYPH